MNKNLKPVITHDKNAKNTFLLVLPILPVYIFVPINQSRKTTSKMNMPNLKSSWLKIYYYFIMPVFLSVLLILSFTGKIDFGAISWYLICLILISPLLFTVIKLKLPGGIELETAITDREKDDIIQKGQAPP